MLVLPGDWQAPLAAAEEAIAVDFNTLVGPASVSKATSPSYIKSEQQSTRSGATTASRDGVTFLCILTAPVTTFARAEEHRPRSVDDRIGHERENPQRVQQAVHTAERINAATLTLGQSADTWAKWRRDNCLFFLFMALITTKTCPETRDPRVR